MKGKMFSKKEWGILIALVVLVLVVYVGLLFVVTRGGGAKVESAIPPSRSPWKGLTAQEAYPLAEEVARAWQPDAELSSTSSAWRGGTTPQELLQGKTTWGFHFISPSVGQFCVVTVVGDQAQVMESSSIPRVPVLLALTDWQVDSPQALSIFLDNGGRDFLAAHADADVHLHLSTKVENETLTWLATGLAADDEMVHTVSINAVTGAVIETQ
jgi:hypothetical protein